MAIKISKLLNLMKDLKEVLRQIQARAEVVQTNYRAALQLRGSDYLCETLVHRLRLHEQFLDPIIEDLASASAELLAALVGEYDTKPLETLLARTRNWELACFINRLSEQVEAHEAHLRTTLSFSSDATIRKINVWASQGMHNFTGLRQPLEPVVTIPYEHPSFDLCRCSFCRTGKSYTDSGNAFTPIPSNASLRRTGIKNMAGISANNSGAGTSVNDPEAGPSQRDNTEAGRCGNEPVPGTSNRMQVAKKSTGGKSQRQLAVENVVPRVVHEADDKYDSNDSSIMCLEEVEVLNRSGTIELSDSDNEDGMEFNQDQEEVVSLASGEEADVVNDDGTVDTVWK